MESINNVINLIKLNVHMASIDLKDAFFSVHIHYDHRKYLKFIFGNLFQCTSMSNGYGPAMRIFTKIKIPFGHLRSKGHISVVYVDNSYLQGDTYQSCLANIVDTIKLLRELSFVVHSDKKSVLTPCQTIVFLGFVLSSKHMTLLSEMPTFKNQMLTETRIRRTSQPITLSLLSGVQG